MEWEILSHNGGFQMKSKTGSGLVDVGTGATCP